MVVITCFLYCKKYLLGYAEIAQQQQMPPVQQQMLPPTRPTVPSPSSNQAKPLSPTKDEMI